MIAILFYIAIGFYSLIALITLCMLGTFRMFLQPLRVIASAIFWPITILLAIIKGSKSEWLK